MLWIFTKSEFRLTFRVVSLPLLHKLPLLYLIGWYLDDDKKSVDQELHWEETMYSVQCTVYSVKYTYFCT